MSSVGYRYELTSLKLNNFHRKKIKKHHRFKLMHNDTENVSTSFPGSSQCLLLPSLRILLMRFWLRLGKTVMFRPRLLNLRVNAYSAGL
jgi:hypothetical protein